mmetsp:Transcript_3436/g.4979  ORF Transcript_3436/g.4979 Transcript_3436/m.4979 type:complete len:245 (-) Transcript_3436:80-814(-)
MSNKSSSANETRGDSVCERNAVRLQDYIHMHGMLCHPATAQRTLNSFDGTILFMPFDYLLEEEAVDCIASSSVDFGCHDFTGVTVFMYYLLVICSFTGLSTLLKQTKFLVGREENEEMQPPKNNETSREVQYVAEHNKNLQVHRSVLNYVKERSGSKLIRLKRRFEYDFGGIAKLSVMMLHFYSEDTGLLHLVEVYQIKNPAVRKFVGTLLFLWHWTRFRFHQLLQKSKPGQSEKATRKRMKMD